MEKLLRVGILLVGLFLSPAALSEQMELQTFEEICEITGEVKQRFVYPSAFSQLTVVEPMDLEEN
jgi:hypothetical protein